MKSFFTLLILLVVSISHSQVVKVDERNATFNAGSKNAIVVTIPHSNSDFVEKRIKEEIKSWGGKNGSSKGEYTSTQSQIKEMGDKFFDGFAKIIDSKDGTVTVAFSFDLGGAFLSSSEHKDQYGAMSSKLKAFAINAAKESVSEELKDQEKILRNNKKDQESLEKDKLGLESDIENYKKKIEEALQKIEKNKQDQAVKKEDIKKQTIVVEEVNKKLGSIK